MKRQTTKRYCTGPNTGTIINVDLLCLSGFLNVLNYNTDHPLKDTRLQTLGGGTKGNNLQQQLSTSIFLHGDVFSHIVAQDAKFMQFSRGETFHKVFILVVIVLFRCLGKRTFGWPVTKTVNWFSCITIPNITEMLLNIFVLRVLVALTDIFTPTTGCFPTRPV